jgi:DNA-binding beta-propeller fold protein YncE
MVTAPASTKHGVSPCRDAGVAASDQASTTTTGTSATAAHASWHRRGSALMALAGALLLAACASGPTTPARLTYSLEDLPASTVLVWPAPPEPARYAYAGSLTGERNFIADNASGSRLRSFGRWLAGLDDGDQPVALQRPSVVLGDNLGRLYVSDASRQAVLVFDKIAGQLLVWDKASGAINFRSPSGLALAPGGGLYVADADLGAVYRLDAKGEPRAEIGRGKLARPTGLAVDPATGLLFVADTKAHDIKVFDAAGALHHVIGSRGEALGEFNSPTHLAWARGELYVTDTFNQRVQVLGGPGLLDLGALSARAIGARGLQLGDLVRPKGVAVDAGGRIYVIESYYDSLLVYGADGEFLLPIAAGAGLAGLVSAAELAGTASASDGAASPVLATAAGRFYLPAGVWVDAENQVFVADMYKGRVVRLKFLAEPGSPDPVLRDKTHGAGG